MKVPAVPSVKVVLAPEVMAGACVDGQREALGGVRAGPVGGGDGDREGTRTGVGVPDSDATE